MVIILIIVVIVIVIITIIVIIMVIVIMLVIVTVIVLVQERVSLLQARCASSARCRFATAALRHALECVRATCPENTATVSGLTAMLLWKPLGGHVLFSLKPQLPNLKALRQQLRSLWLLDDVGFRVSHH